MWRWKHFDSLDSLLHFVNERGLEHYQFKIVNSPAPRRSSPYGAPMFLIYREHPEEAPLLEAAAEAEVPLEEELESAIDAAEEILHSASEGHERR